MSLNRRTGAQLSMYVRKDMQSSSIKRKKSKVFKSIGIGLVYSRNLHFTGTVFFSPKFFQTHRLYPDWPGNSGRPPDWSMLQTVQLHCSTVCSNFWLDWFGYGRVVNVHADNFSIAWRIDRRSGSKDRCQFRDSNRNTPPVQLFDRIYRWTRRLFDWKCIRLHNFAI